jgi:hypothetical protein
MKKVVNEKLIARNKKIGNIASFAGIAILMVGLILNFRPDPEQSYRVWLSFGALIVGFILAQFSTNLVNKFGRRPRIDELVGENLAKLNNSYTMYIYKSPVPMLLVGPSNIWIINPVLAGGEISYENKWKQRGGSFLFKFFGQESLGQPTAEAATTEKKLFDFLSQHISEENMPEINSVLVSINPKATIGDVSTAPVPIMKTDELRRFVRRIDRKTEGEIPETLLIQLDAIFNEFKK